MVLRTLTGALLLATAAAPAQAFLAGLNANNAYTAAPVTTQGAYTRQDLLGNTPVPQARSVQGGKVIESPLDKLWKMIPGDSRQANSGGNNGSTKAGTSEHDRAQASNSSCLGCKP